MIFLPVFGQVMPDPSAFTPQIIAGADNFNPSLDLSEPKPTPAKTPSASDPSTLLINPQLDLKINRQRQKSESPGKPLFVIEGIQPDFRRDLNKFGQENRISEITTQIRLWNDRTISIKTGGNFYRQAGTQSIYNVPLQLSWSTHIGKISIKPSIGVETFNRLPAAPAFSVMAQAPPLARRLTLSGAVEYGPYKFNAQTLDNRISALRWGPTLSLQIDKKTSLFSLARIGSYSDGNFEVQSFSRLERKLPSVRKLGNFAVGTNLFTWSYAKDVALERGYFSPPDFVALSGDLSWEGNISKFLQCRFGIGVGRQRLNGNFTNGRAYQAKCTAKFTDKIEADLGYAFSDARALGTGTQVYNNKNISGQIRAKF